MSRFLRSLPLVAIPFAWLWSSAACLAPTQIHLVLTSNLCATNPSTEVAIYSGAYSLQDPKSPPPVAVKKLCAGNVVRPNADFYFHPSGATDDYLEVRVVAAVNGIADDCPLNKLADGSTAPGGDSCVIQRRRLRYSENVDVQLEVDLSDVCLGEACDKNSTCVQKGICKPSDVEEAKRCDGGPCSDAEAGPVTSNPVYVLAATRNSTCAALANDLKCWGTDQMGESGGQIAGANILSPTEKVDSTTLGDSSIPGRSKVFQMGGGSSHYCAWFAGRLKCWGDNSGGQLGRGTQDGPFPLPDDTSGAVIFPTDNPSFAAVDGDTFYVAGGLTHTCLLYSAGNAAQPASLVCWGYNDKGQIGENGTAKSLTPRSIALPSTKKAIQLAAGADATCLVFDDKTVRCFGGNDSGELGNGNVGSGGQAPVTVAADVIGSGFARVTLSMGYPASGTFACATHEGGLADCWGANNHGQLGRNSITPASSGTPVPVFGGHQFKKVVAGGAHACGIDLLGTVLCWGNNDSGQATGTPGGDQLTPTGTGPTDAVDLALGQSHSCAITSSRAVVCWGANDQGQLGRGTTSTSGQPGPVTL